MGLRNTRFFDAEAAKLHDRTVYDLLKGKVPEDIHPTALQALLGKLDDYDLDLIRSCTDSELVQWKAERLLKARAAGRKPRNVTHRLNYPIDEVLGDYISRRRGRRREARRQLRTRFPGLDHDKQEAVMMAFMSQGTLSDRELIYGQMYEDGGFWVDGYIPLVQRWWEMYHDRKMARVVVKRCPREYVLTHAHELIGRCNYASLCLKTGMRPEEGVLPYRTYLYVMKCVGGTLRPREGEKTVLMHVRECLYEDEQQFIHDSIFDLPYVKRMVRYLGEMGLTDDILALDAFDRRMQDLPGIEWGTDIIRAIEEEFTLPEYIFKQIK